MRSDFDPTLPQAVMFERLARSGDVAVIGELPPGWTIGDRGMAVDAGGTKSAHIAVDAVTDATRGRIYSAVWVGSPLSAEQVKAVLFALRAPPAIALGPHGVMGSNAGMTCGCGAAPDPSESTKCGLYESYDGHKEYVCPGCQDREDRAAWRAENGIVTRFDTEVGRG